MDKIRKQPGYATSQIRLLLSDLKNNNHSVRSKAVKRYKDYIAVYKPEVFDDDVDFLFTGELDGVPGLGLLFYSSEESKKNPGQLKRISQPVLSLIKYLITCDYDGEDNIFFDRFVSLQPAEYSKINFVKHILNDPNSKKGVGCDSMDLIKLIVEDHKDANNCLDPVDINLLIGDNKVCRERLNAFLQKGAAQDIVQIMNQFQEKKAQKPKVFRPTTWAELKYKPVPIQEGEDGEIDNSPVVEEDVAYPDPMALSELDLRATQALYSSGGLKNKQKTIVDSGVNDEDDDDDDDIFTIEGGATNPDGTKLVPSILPFEKYFSPTLYLTIVHGNIAFNDFKPGVENLQKYLSKQRLRREDMARAHFGLFVMCTEGLEWMKQYRKGKTMDDDGDVLETDETRLNKAHSSLEMAKADAQRALAPIMASMKKNRRIRNADQVLRRLASTLEYPHKMRQALDKGHLEEVISIYQRVQALPANSSLRILGRVKESSETVAADLKKICIEKLNTANSSFKELLRHAKILEDMDGLQSFVDHVKQSFHVQLNHYHKLIDELFEAFVNDAINAYTKGQEMNTNASLNRERSVTDASNVSCPLEVKIVRQGEYFGHHDDDENENDVEDDLDRIIFNDIDTTLPPSDKSNGTAEQVEKWKASVSDFCISSCAEARLTYLEKFGDIVETWLPCLYLLAETHQQAAPGIVQESKLRKVSGAILKAIGEKKGVGGGKRDTSNLTRVLGQTLSLMSDMIRQAVFGFAGEIITPSSMQKKAALSIFKSRKSSVDPGDSTDSVLSQSIFGLVLPEPYFTRSINQVTDLYDTIETCLVKSRVFKSVNEGIEQETHMSPTNPYYDSLAVMRTMSKDGEVSLASKVMARLLNHFSIVLENTYKINSSSKEIEAVSKIQPFGQKVASKSAESATKELETLLSKGLNRIPLRLRRPDWISNCIHAGILNLFRSFVSFLKRLVILSVELPLAENGMVDVNGRKSITNKLGNVEDLVTLEKNLRYNESKDVDIADTLLDVVKACVALRTRIIGNAWKETINIFTFDSNETLDMGEQLTSIFPDTDYKFEKSDVRHRRPTVQILSSSQYGHNQMKDKLSKVYQSLQKGVYRNVTDVITLECDAVRSYINHSLAAIKETVHSSYNVIVTNELAGHWKSPSSQSSSLTSPGTGNISFPLHLSRLMLHISNEKRTLSDILDGIKFETGYENTVDGFADQPSPNYKDIIFTNICQGLLQIYYDLIITLEINTFANLKHAHVSSATTTPVKKNEPINPFQAGLDEATKGKDIKVAASLHPLSQWQATEEMEYLKLIFQPIFGKADNKFINELDRMAGFDKRKETKHQNPGAGVKYCTTQQLLDTGKVFTIMINK